MSARSCHANACEAEAIKIIRAHYFIVIRADYYN